MLEALRRVLLRQGYQKARTPLLYLPLGGRALRSSPALATGIVGSTIAVLVAGGGEPAARAVVAAGSKTPVTTGGLLATADEVTE
jgi:hypothetical protein